LNTDNPLTIVAQTPGFLPMTQRHGSTWELLDWTGRAVRNDSTARLEKRGAIPADLAPIFDRLQLSRDTWVAAGRLAAEAARRGRRWLAGISHSREAFG
jgi:hypothetical protein